MADISVPCWNDVNIDDLCAGARLIAFDLDNTLARSKKPMKDDMAECFSALTSLIDVAVITGGKYALLKSQVVETADRAGKPGESASYADQRHAILSLGWCELDAGLRPRPQ